MLTTNFVMAQEQEVKQKFDCLIGYFGSPQEPIINGQSFCPGTVLNFSSCDEGGFNNANLPADVRCIQGKVGTYTIVATHQTTGVVTSAITTFTLPIAQSGASIPVAQLILTEPGCYSIQPFWSYVSQCDPLIVKTISQGLNNNAPTTVCITAPANALPPIITRETPNPICANSEVCFLTDRPESGTIRFSSPGVVYNFNDPNLTTNFVSYNTSGQEITRICYTYPTPGNYQVSRTNFGTCGGSNQSSSINVNVVENNLSIKHSLETDCNGFVSFGPSLQCPTQVPSVFSWNFGDGTTGVSYSNVNGGLITHQYTDPNLATATVTVSANGGAPYTYIVNVITEPNINLQAAYSDVTKACSPQETYTLTGVPAGFTVNWTISGGNFTTPNNQATIGVNWTATENDPVAGPFLEGGSISVTVTNGSCQHTKTFEIASCCASRTATQNISSPKGEITINDVFPTVSQLNGGTYYIDGKLIIDKDFTLVGTHFKMGPYAEIEVRDPYTFTLDNSTITAGCEIMWQQIYVGFKANFVAKNNSRVEDGITAVYGENGGTVIVRDSYFNKNHIAFFIIDYASGTYPLEITNTKISCSYAAPYSAVGVTYPNLGLRIPYAGQRSLKGVELNNVDNAKIGDPTTIANKNTFFQLDYGIYAKRSSVEVYNNHFKEIYDATKTSTNEYAIYVDNQNKPQIKINRTLKVGDPVNATATNMFEVCEVGIETNYNVNSYIYKNTFDDMFWAMRISFNTKNNTAIINQNTITDMMRGIECYSNTWCATEITLNTLNYNQPPTAMPTNAFGEYGILINEENKPASGRYTVKTNTIRNVVFGVEVKGTEKTIIESNLIRIEPAFVNNTINNYEAGIRILNTAGTSAKCNDIATTSNSSAIRTVSNFRKYNGVYTTQAVGASIIDNKIEDIGVGTFFDVSCKCNAKRL